MARLSVYVRQNEMVESLLHLLSTICLALGREDHLVWIKIKKNDCHAIWLATICHEDDVRTDYRVDAERVQARQPSIRAPFFFHSRSVNIIVKRKSFVKLVDDRDNCASLCESLNLNLRWKKRKKRKKERKGRKRTTNRTIRMCELIMRTSTNACQELDDYLD